MARDEGPYTRALKAVAAWLEHLEAPAALIGGAAVIAFLEALSDTSPPPNVPSGLPVGGL